MRSERGYSCRYRRSRCQHSPVRPPVPDGVIVPDRLCPIVGIVSLKALVYYLQGTGGE